ncbi:hypothetical protein HOE04_00895 [archaeon]|jgi:hypothetical protein|nr:hypothetical protein [archaeon]
MTTIVEDITRQVYVESLLKDYSTKEVIEGFGIPKSEVESTLEHYNPIAEKEDELSRLAATFP